MAEKHPRTTFIVAADRDALVLEKLAAIEDALNGLVPLLEQMLRHLEAQTTPPAVEVATYAQLYDEIVPGPPEGELVAETLPPAQIQHRPWWRRFFVRDQA